ncbi:MAG: WbqC family protein [Bacteroidales bacterium]|nr:WbqC family protein [Bacteroidales bacterium]
MKNSDEAIAPLATAYMPPVAFWVAAARMGQAQEGAPLRLCQDERYHKQTYRNRTVILNAQGEQRLSVPVSCPRGPHTKAEDVRICYDKDWQRDHWRSLCTAYNNSPYFLYYRDELEAILVQTRCERLWDLNWRLIVFFVKAFGLNWTVEAVSRREDENLRAADTRRTAVAVRAVDSQVQTELESGILAFSDKTPQLWQRFAPSVAPEDYRNTFMQAVACPARLSSCDLLFNYGPQARTLFA